MSNQKSTTIVFQHESDSLIIKDMLKAFAENESGYADARITAVSLQNEISRLELLENAIDHGDLKRAKKIIQMDNSEIVEKCKELANARLQ